MSDDALDVLTFSPAAELMGADEPKAAPKAPAPVTKEDPNVKAASDATRRRLQSSRQAARVLQPGMTSSTLG